MDHATIAAQHAETAASLRDHYTAAINAQDIDRAIQVAADHHRITGQWICADDPDHTSPEWWTVRHGAGYDGIYCTPCAARLQLSIQGYARQTDILPEGVELIR
jgi:hypothetical protein